jgi:hypothetical protein
VNFHDDERTIILRAYLALWDASPSCARAYTARCLAGCSWLQISEDMDIRYDYVGSLISRAHLYLIAQQQGIPLDGGLERTAYRVKERLPDNGQRHSLAWTIDTALRAMLQEHAIDAMKLDDATYREEQIHPLCG